MKPKYPKTQEQIIKCLESRRVNILEIANNLHDVSRQDYPWLVGLGRELTSVIMFISDDRPINIVEKTNFVTLESGV